MTVSDATPLIALARIKCFPLLKELFSLVLIPSAVYGDVVTRGAGRPGDVELRAALADPPAGVRNALSGGYPALTLSDTRAAMSGNAQPGRVLPGVPHHWVKGCPTTPDNSFQSGTPLWVCRTKRFSAKILLS